MAVRRGGKSGLFAGTVLVSAVLLLAGAGATEVRHVSQWEWENAPRLVGIGDVHMGASQS